MVRKIVIIDQERCNGCGQCVDACHEGAIAMRDGKAVLLRDDYCDGLGDCLPACPTDAISFEEREALPYDEAAVLENMKKTDGSCAGSAVMDLKNSAPRTAGPFAMAPKDAAFQAGHGAILLNDGAPTGSNLRQWPVQIRLAPAIAPYFNGADILVAADCTAYAYAAFHDRFMKDRMTLIGCPKLDPAEYAEKLSAIFTGNDVRSVTLVRMSVPCCSGIVKAAEEAIAASGKAIPLDVFVLTVQGELGRDR